MSRTDERRFPARLAGEHPTVPIYRRLRALSQRYVEALNRRDMSDPDSAERVGYEQHVAELEAALDAGELALAAVLGAERETAWHPMEPRHRALEPAR